MSDAFDVFLCHNGSDKSVVRQLANDLKGRGLRVWLDENELIPGLFWQTDIEKAIQKVTSVAVLVGPDGQGPWQKAELRAAIGLAVQRDLPVIPVLLPGVSEEPDLPLVQLVAAALLTFVASDLSRLAGRVLRAKNGSGRRRIGFALRKCRLALRRRLPEKSGRDARAPSGDRMGRRCGRDARAPSGFLGWRYNRQSSWFWAARLRRGPELDAGGGRSVYPCERATRGKVFTCR